jgi:hypothetical protein
MRGAIPPLPQYVSMAWCLVKHRDSFTFAFIPKYVICIYTHIYIYIYVNSKLVNSSFFKGGHRSAILYWESEWGCFEVTAGPRASRATFRA